MPYEVKHTTAVTERPGEAAFRVVLSRRAVGTLEEGRTWVLGLGRPVASQLSTALLNELFEPRGRGVIDLPDGGRIEVRWEEDDE